MGRTRGANLSKARARSYDLALLLVRLQPLKEGIHTRELLVAMIEGLEAHTPVGLESLRLLRLLLRGCSLIIVN
jgi:hypothetical protein